MEMGLSRINNELRLDRTLKDFIKTRIVINTIFSQMERFLLKNNRAFVLNTDQSSDAQSQSTKMSNQTYRGEINQKWFTRLLEETGVPSRKDNGKQKLKRLKKRELNKSKSDKFERVDSLGLMKDVEFISITREGIQEGSTR